MVPFLCVASDMNILYLPTVTADNAGVSLVASVIMLVPALLIFLFGQKYLEAGISAAGMKD